MGYFVQILFIAVFCVIATHQQSCSTFLGQDIDLPNLASHNGQPRQSQCCNICSNTPGCRAYAWNNYEGGTCWLKAGSGPLISKGDVTSGILSDGGGNLVSFGEFTNAVRDSNGYPAPTEAQYNAFSAGLANGQITTKQEAAMALTHFLHESDGLRAKREYRCQNNGCPGEYETPGCDVAGQDYYGRGYIQLTWCYNYRPASQDLYGDNRMVNDPDMVARDENLAWDAAYWFWKVNVHSQPGVSEERFGVTTNAVNGDLECRGANQDTARHRFQMYGRVRAAFGLSGAGDERGCYN